MNDPTAIPPIDPSVAGNPGNTDAPWVPPWLAQPDAPPVNAQQTDAPVAPAAPAAVQTPDDVVTPTTAPFQQTAPAVTAAPWSITPDVHPDAIVNPVPPWLAQAQHDQSAPKLGAVDYALSQELGEPTSTGEDPAASLHRIATDPQASVSDRQLAWKQMTPEDRTNVVNNADPTQLAQLATAAMSSEELATIQVRHQQAQLHQQNADNLTAAVLADQAARRNADAYTAAVQHANAQTDAIARDAANLANTKIVTPGGPGFAALSILGSMIGGVAAKGAGISGNPFIEGLNKGIEQNIAIQRAEIENGWKGIDARKNLVAEQFQRSGDLYRAQEVVRIAHYDYQIKQAQIAAQDYDPQGTTALGIAQQTQQIQAARGAALNATNQQYIKNHLDQMKAENEAATLKESIREHKETASLGWANYSREKNDALAKNQIERDKIAEQQAQREAAQGQAQEEKDIKQIIHDPTTGAAMLAPAGQQMVAQAKDIEAQAAKVTDPVQQRKLLGQADQLRKSAVTNYALRRDEKEHGETQNHVNSAQTFVNDVDRIKQLLAGDPSSFDRETWARVGADYEHAKGAYIKAGLADKVTSREMDAVSDTFAGKPGDMMTRAAGRNKLMSALDELQTLVGGSVATELRGAGAVAPKGGSVWTPKISKYTAIDPLSDATSTEAGQDARLGVVTQPLSFTSNDERQVKVEDSGAFGVTGLSKRNTETVDKLVRSYSAAKEPEERERIANQLAAYASSPRESIVTGVAGLVRDNPAAYSAMLNAPTLSPDARAALQEQDALHSTLQSQLVDPNANLTPEQIDAAIAKMSPDQHAKLDALIEQMRAARAKAKGTP